MNILYISYAYPVGRKGLYSDLGEALVRNGHSVKVVVSNPKIEEATKIVMQDGVEILNVKTSQLFNIGKIKKAVSLITLPGKLKSAIRKHYLNESFDLVLSEAPPVSFYKLIAWAKKQFKCPVFLQQKDIFPENAADIGLLSRKSPIYQYFRRQEVRLLKDSDFIGCMSDGNKRFLTEHNKFLSPDKCVYFPNSMRIGQMPEKTRRSEVCAKYGIPDDACIFLFGGNLGYVQYIDFLCEILKRYKDDAKVYFLIVGSGLFENKIIRAISENSIGNAKYVPLIPRDQYDEVANHADVGLIIVDPRYNIPNYPSKTLGYMHSCIPILAATDLNTDYRNLIEDEAKCGLWAWSGDIDAFSNQIDAIKENPALREKLGMNGRKYLEKHFDVEESVRTLERLFEKKQVT